MCDKFGSTALILMVPQEEKNNFINCAHCTQRVNALCISYRFMLGKVVIFEIWNYFSKFKRLSQESLN